MAEEDCIRSWVYNAIQTELNYLMWLLHVNRGSQNSLLMSPVETLLDNWRLQNVICLQEDSCPDFMKKAEECLKQEEERVDNYLHADSKKGLLAEVEREVLANYEAQVLEKENSGCAALLRDNKVKNWRTLLAIKLARILYGRAIWQRLNLLTRFLLCIDLRKKMRAPSIARKFAGRVTDQIANNTLDTSFLWH